MTAEKLYLSFFFCSAVDSSVSSISCVGSRAHGSLPLEDDEDVEAKSVCGEKKCLAADVLDG